jgi:deferrochelatase/peroxidase EfeB
VGSEGPAWLRGGSYVVVRRIRIALEHWDLMNIQAQEETVGRHKYSGAPIGASGEFDAVDLDAVDKDGNLVIPSNAHVRLAVAASNGGARIMRRPYSYNDGVSFTAERWPPWRQGMEYDAGLLFIAYQSDPRTGFIKIFENMSKLDMLNQFATHTGGGLFACPPGMREGEYIGQKLFEEA